MSRSSPSSVGLSQDSLFFRFFSLGANLEAAAEWAADVDYEHRFGLIATSGGAHRIVGHAGYS